MITLHTSTHHYYLHSQNSALSSHRKYTIHSASAFRPNPSLLLLTDAPHLKEKEIVSIHAKEADGGRQSVETVIDTELTSQFFSIYDNRDMTRTPNLLGDSPPRLTPTPTIAGSSSRADCNSITTVDLSLSETNLLSSDRETIEEQDETLPIEPSANKKRVQFKETKSVALIPTRHEFAKSTLNILDLTDQEIASLPPEPMQFTLKNLLWMHRTEYFYYKKHGDEEAAEVLHGFKQRIAKSITPFAICMRCLEQTNNGAYYAKLREMCLNKLFSPVPREYPLKKVVTIVETPTIINILSRSDYINLGVADDLWQRKFNYPAAKEMLDRYWNFYFNQYALPVLEYVADEELIGKIESILEDIRDFVWDRLTTS